MTDDGNLKISDFDLSKEIDNTWMSMSSCCGTPLWMAPEILFDKTYTKAVCVYTAQCDHRKILGRRLELCDRGLADDNAKNAV